MPRYTIEVESYQNELNLDLIRISLENSLSKRISIHSFRLSVQRLSKGLLLLDTDLNPEKLSTLLNDIKQDKDIKKIVLRYGWLISSEMTDMAHLSEKEEDPYYFQSPLQSTDSYTYTEDMHSKVHTIINILLLISSIMLCYIGYTKSEFVIALFGLILTVVFVNSFLSTILYIRCDLMGIEFKYLFKPSKIILWTEIKHLRIQYIRSEWCTLQTYAQKIAFPLSQVFEADKKNKLLKTIITRAKLCYFESTPSVIYRCPDPI